ncbi:MAG: serine/threonine protein kinase [Myxococcota bacterium]
MLGQRFGKYILIRKLATGGMADIYLARQEGVEGFQKDIVIKKIRAEIGQKPEFVQMFLNEAKLAAMLTHPNICQIFDLGKIGDSYFIAMEYIAGRDMNRIINASAKRGIPFPMEYALKIASNVCEGLYYAHSKVDYNGNPLNIVHRDITPENIMVSWDGAVKILDFGIAKATNLVSTDREGEVKGKLSYISPEQLQGKEADQRSDIFSLGVVLYEWITGYKLFRGETDEAVIKSITEGKIYPPSFFKPDLPKQVEKILMSALEKDPEKRYKNAWDMQFEIDSFLSQHEFTPSNVHLSNFIKQLFKDEIEKERKITGKKIIAVPPPLPGSKSPHRTIANAGRTVQINLPEDIFVNISQIAQKNEMTVSNLVEEIVKFYLKYK